MNKKLLTAITLCGMVAGFAQAANIRYKANGDWGATTNSTGDAYGWRTTGALPGLDDQGQINWGGATVTVTATETIGSVRVGQDEAGNLIVASSGNLTTDGSGAQSGDFTLGQGNNPLGTGTLTVQSGGVLNVGNILYNGNKADGTAEISGTVNVASHLWTGWNNGFTGTYNINDGGLLDVEGMLGLNWQNNGGIGLINVNDGGVLDLAQIHGTGNSIQGDSLITIAGSGVMYKSQNFVGVINQYIADGKIVGAGGAGLSVTYDEGLNRTVVAIPEPATMGLIVAFGGILMFMRRLRVY